MVPTSGASPANRLRSLLVTPTQTAPITSEAPSDAAQAGTWKITTTAASASPTSSPPSNASAIDPPSDQPASEPSSAISTPAPDAIAPTARFGTAARSENANPVATSPSAAAW